VGARFRCDRDHLIGSESGVVSAFLKPVFFLIFFGGVYIFIIDPLLLLDALCILGRLGNSWSSGGVYVNVFPSMEPRFSFFALAFSRPISVKKNLAIKEDEIFFSICGEVRRF